LVSIDVSALDGQLKDEVASFLEAKLPITANRDGDVLDFGDKSDRSHISTPEIRTYLKRFLHKNKIRKDYRLLSDEGVIAFVKRKKEEDDDEQESSGTTSKKK
jgi:hypothetical protein